MIIPSPMDLPLVDLVDGTLIFVAMLAMSGYMLADALRWLRARGRAD
jgi:hypothetical protein